MYNIKLKELLKTKNKSRYWLQKETGISFQTIANLVNNTTSAIHFDTLAKICNILDCTPNDIIKITKE